MANGIISYVYYISQVLETVFEHCAFNDLKSARLVSHLWYQESIKPIGRRSRLHISSYEELREFMETFTKTSNPPDSPGKCGAPLSPLWTSVLLSGSVSFQGFAMPLVPFFKMIRSQLKVLEIDQGQATLTAPGAEATIEALASVNVENLEVLIFSGSQLGFSKKESQLGISPLFLPSVKTLKVTLRNRTAPKDGYRFFREILRGLPNLESITCINYSFPCLYVAGIIRLLPRHLTKLHLHLWNHVGIEEFISQNYCIVDLKLDIETSLGQETLLSLMENLSGSLKSLELNFRTTQMEGDYHFSYIASKFPCPSLLKSLTYLRLVAFWGNLYFLKEIPSLTRVDVERMPKRIAFPSGIQNEELLPVKTRKIIRFYGYSTSVFHEL